MRWATLALGGVLTAAAAPAGPLRLTDDFERGLCVGRCSGAIWAISQQQDGRVAVAAAPERAGRALRVEAGPKRGGVAKADLVARTAPIGVGSLITIAFDLRVPAPVPLDSIQLLDLECATCGEGGNPGVRLYLRRGRLRIDRSKIGIAHAWTRDDAAVLANSRWHRVTMFVRVGAGDDGGARVLLDGREVLAARGSTIMPVARRHIDRIQIGVTANSNAVPVTLWIDNVSISARRLPV